jgi:SPP1 family predicted phage head-tail adaptor
MPLSAGTLRDRVTVLAPSEDETGLGETLLRYAAVGSVWANVRSISSQELVQMQQATLQVTHVVRMRYFSGLTPMHRIRHRSTDMEILSVLDSEQRSIHELVCREITVQ